MADYDYITQRLFVDGDLKKDHPIKTERIQANYLLNVLRMKDGARILVFNGRHGEWLGEVTDVKRKSCSINPLLRTRPQPEPYDLVYLFAPLKKGRMDYMVQKAVEMGVGVLQPIITEFTQFSKLNTAKLQTNVVEAAQQCGILSLAKIKEPLKLRALLQDWDTSRKIIYCDEDAKFGNVSETLAPLKSSPKALLVGPEGGFSESERKVLRSMDCVTSISLGPRILRADTAAVAALAMVQSIAGDW